MIWFNVKSIVVCCCYFWMNFFRLWKRRVQHLFFSTLVSKLGKWRGGRLTATKIPYTWFGYNRCGAFVFDHLNFRNRISVLTCWYNKTFWLAALKLFITIHQSSIKTMTFKSKLCTHAHRTRTWWWIVRGAAQELSILINLHGHWFDSSNDVHHIKSAAKNQWTWLVWCIKKVFH